MVIVNIKMEPEEKMQLKKDAYQHEMTVSQYIRWLIAKEREE